MVNDLLLKKLAKLSLSEFYRGQDGSLFKIQRLPVYSRYERLSEEEVNELAGETECNTKSKGLRKKDIIENFETEISDLPHIHYTINKSKAGSFTQEPAADGRVRTDTSIHGGDYLQFV
jgi:hypothetical protein